MNQQLIPGMVRVRKGMPSTGTQAAMPQQQPMAPVQLAHEHQQPTKVLIHAHPGHPDPHPIALRHSTAHTDSFHGEEDKLVDAYMKLADMANEGKATPEHMGQMDGIKIQLSGIQQKRAAEHDRLGQFMQQRQVQDDEQDAGPGAPMPGGQRAMPVGAERGVSKDMNDQTQDAGASASRGMRTTAQLSTAGGGWYSNGLSYQQKATVEREPGERPTIGMESDWGSEPQLTGTIDRQPGERPTIGAQSNMAFTQSATPQQPKAITPAPAPKRAEGGTAKPATSVFAKAAKPQAVTAAVATIAPDEAGEPETKYGKVTQRK